MNIARYLNSAVALPQRKYIYRLMLRPAGMYLPEGWSIATRGRYNGGEDGTYGTIAYSRPLTEKEKKECEVLEYVTVDEAVHRILAEPMVVARLKPYVNDRRTNIHNTSDNPFAYWIEDAMYKGRFYSDWQQILVILNQLLA